MVLNELMKIKCECLEVAVLYNLEKQVSSVLIIEPLHKTRKPLRSISHLHQAKLLKT